jgi:hypothetical protein
MKKLLILTMITLFVTSCAVQQTPRGYDNVWETKNGKLRKMRRTERPSCIDSW